MAFPEDLYLTDDDIRYIVEQTISMLGDEVAEKYDPYLLERRLQQFLTFECTNENDNEYREELIREYKEEIEEAKQRIKKIVYNVKADFDDEIA